MTSAFVECVEEVVPGGAVPGGVRPGWNIPGGRFAIEDPVQLKELSANITLHLNKLKESDDKVPNLELIKLHSANYHVVSGIIYEGQVTLKEGEALSPCEVSLWQQWWLNHTKFDVKCGEAEPKRYWLFEVGADQQRRKRAGFGAPSRVSEDEFAEVKLYAEKSIQQLNEEKNTDFIILRIFDAERQVISGSKITITAELKSSTKESETCTITIIEQSFENGFRQTDVKCKESNYQVIKNPKPTA